jgi:hypothetical protein
MESKKLSAGEMIENYFEANVIDVVFEEVNTIHPTVESQLISHQDKMGVKVQSVAMPPQFKVGIKSEKETLNWLCKTVQNEFCASRILFLKYNSEGEREDWQNNKATNRRFLETKNLYKKGLYYNKLFQNND